MTNPARARLIKNSIKRLYEFQIEEQKLAFIAHASNPSKDNAKRLKKTSYDAFRLACLASSKSDSSPGKR